MKINIKSITKYFFVIFSLLLILNPIFAFAQNNVGFVSSSIWYSKDPFYEGDKIQIYTLVFNQEEKDLIGTVNFFNGSTSLGKEDIFLPKGDWKVISIDWVVIAGSHTFFATLSDTKFVLENGKYEDIILEQVESGKSKKIVIKKIIPEIEDIKDLGDKVETEVEKSIENIVEQTPESVKTPIVKSTNALEKLRENTLEYAQEKKEEVKQILENVKQEKKIEEEQEKSNDKSLVEKIGDEKEELSKQYKEGDKVFKPWQYLKLFFFGIVVFILESKIAFYSFLFIILIIILRTIWRKIAS